MKKNASVRLCFFFFSFLFFFSCRESMQYQDSEPSRLLMVDSYQVEYQFRYNASA
jgi:hypothetical protein